MQVGVADEPADLRERGRERRTVDRDAAAPCPRPLDDVDAAVLGRGPVAGRQRRLEDLQVERLASATPSGWRPRPRSARVARPCVVADPRGAGLAEPLVRRDVGRSSGSRRPRGCRCRRPCRWVEGRRSRDRSSCRRAVGPAEQRLRRRTAARRSGPVGPNRDDVGTVSRTASSLAIAAPAKSVADTIVRRTAMTGAVGEAAAAQRARRPGAAG